jgi:AcrR family transcriptional regulator
MTASSVVGERPASVREACIVAAREVIATRGIEQLSLREVARNLRVSHQAPYKHFRSRDHLLAEVIRRCFQSFAAHLDARVRQDDPRADLRALGQRYLSFASEQPLEYRLMFVMSWPALANHADLLRDATHAFNILRDALRRVHAGMPAADETAELDALFIWSAMHGVIGVMQGDCVGHVGLSAAARERAVVHVMDRVGLALAAARGGGLPPPAGGGAASLQP